jgi:hypothetical protein
VLVIARRTLATRELNTAIAKSVCLRLSSPDLASYTAPYRLDFIIILGLALFYPYHSQNLTDNKYERHRKKAHTKSLEKRKPRI